MTDKEILEQADKTLKQLQGKISKFTKFVDTYHIERANISEERNIMAGRVYEARKELDGVLNQTRSNIADALASVDDCEDAGVAPISDEMVSAGMQMVMTVLPDASHEDAGSVSIGVFMAMLSMMEGGTDSFFNEAEGEIYRFGEIKRQ